MNNEVDEKELAAETSVDEADADEMDSPEAEDESVKGNIEPTDNVGDVSVEINVEELIADIEGADDEDASRKKEIRRRLEDMAEEKSFEDTYAIDLGDEEE